MYSSFFCRGLVFCHGLLSMNIHEDEDEGKLSLINPHTKVNPTTRKVGDTR